MIACSSIFSSIFENPNRINHFNMTNKQEHLVYWKSKGDFVIDCDLKIFSPEEIDILRHYGHWFRALTDGILQPCTIMQQAFVDVAHERRVPITPAEHAWFRYLKRKWIEEKYGDSLKNQYVPAQDTFYNRDMAKTVKKMMAGENLKNHLRSS